MIRKILPAVIFLLSSLSAICQNPAGSNTVNSNRVITDPQQITSKSKLDVQPLSIEKLYLTHSVGDSTWSPDGKQVAFISNISGRRNLWLVPARRVARTAHG